jgi:uncharacterized damage-inducible protein DinB
MPSLGAIVILAATPHLAAQGPAATPPGVRSEITIQFDAAGSKLLQLAKALPADTYAWRPAEGVRSVSEVLMHVAGASYLFTRHVGSNVTAPFGPGGEKTVTTKPAVIGALTTALDHARFVIGGMPEGDLDKTVSFFGTAMTYRGMLLGLVSLTHQHLGQLIAYTRVNGIAPPWSKPDE